MAEDKIEHSTEKQLIATEFIISKSDEFGKSFFVQRCSELIVTLRAERKKVEQHAQEHANWFKEFYKQTGAPKNVSPIVAYNAERKALEKLVVDVAMGHDEACPNDVFGWVLDDCQPDWCTPLPEIDCDSIKECWLRYVRKN